MGDEAELVADMAARLAVRSRSGSRRALDCGCGRGRVAAALGRRGLDVTGIELSPSAAEDARRVCSRVDVGDLTAAETWRAIEGPFDVVVFSHVLEHVMEPRALIDRARGVLAPGGGIVIVLPNVATWKMRLHLLAGRWEYADEGVLDRTHVRFYTLESALGLVEESGLVLDEAFLYQIPAAGNLVRRALVETLRRGAPLPFTHSFVLAASGASG